MLFSHSTNVLNEVRDRAFEDFKRQGFPSKKVERYRYTDIQELFAPDYGLNLNRLEIPVDPYQAFRCDVPNLSTSLYFVVNDGFHKKTLPKSQLPEGVVVSSLRDVAEQNPELVGRYYARIAETGKDAFRAEFTGVAAKVVAELEVHTLQVTLVAFDHGIAYRHVAAPGENQRLVKESIDTRRGEQGQGAVLLAEVTDHPVEVLSDIALDIQPCDRDALRGIREVVLHARLEAENHVETGRVVGAEMEVQVSRHELGALDIGHLVNFGLLLVGRHVGVDEQALNASAYFQAALCFKGILLRFQQLVHLVIRLCGRDRSSDKER